jgi:hypothetical protein
MRYSSVRLRLLRWATSPATASDCVGAWRYGRFVTIAL